MQNIYLSDEAFSLDRLYSKTSIVLNFILYWPLPLTPASIDAFISTHSKNHINKYSRFDRLN